MATESREPCRQDAKVMPTIDCSCGKHIVPRPGAIEIQCRCKKVYRLYGKDIDEETIYYFKEVANENQQ